MSSVNMGIAMETSGLHNITEGVEAVNLHWLYGSLHSHTGHSGNVLLALCRVPEEEGEVV